MLYKFRDIVFAPLFIHSHNKICNFGRQVHISWASFLKYISKIPLTKKLHFERFGYHFMQNHKTLRNKFDTLVSLKVDMLH